MGLVITLTAARGKPMRTVMDPTRVLNELLPLASDRTFRCLGFVDEYGRAVFNRSQMPDLIAELECVAEKADAEQKELIAQLLEMAKECRDRVHLFIMFRGD